LTDSRIARKLLLLCDYHSGLLDSLSETLDQIPVGERFFIRKRDRSEWRSKNNHVITLPLRVFKEQDGLHLTSILSTAAYLLTASLVGIILVLRNRVDIVLGIFGFPQGFASMLIGKITHRKIGVLTDGGDIDVLLRNVLVRPLMLMSLRKADAVAALNRPKANQLLALGIEAHISTTFGVDTSRFRYVPIDRKHKWLILYVGRLSSEKSLETLLKACRKLHRAGVGFQLAIVGDGPLRPEIMDIAAQAGLADILTIEGYVPHSKIHEFFQKAAIFVLPSIREGTSVSLLEAMSSGCVCITSDIPDNIEIIQHMRTGITFRVGDDEDLANKLNWVISHPSKLARITRNARDKAEKEYSLQAVADSLVPLLPRVDRASA